MGGLVLLLRHDEPIGGREQDDRQRVGTDGRSRPSVQQPVLDQVCQSIPAARRTTVRVAGCEVGNGPLLQIGAPVEAFGVAGEVQSKGAEVPCLVRGGAGCEPMFDPQAIHLRQRQRQRAAGEVGEVGRVEFAVGGHGQQFAPATFDKMDQCLGRRVQRLGEHIVERVGLVIEGPDPFGGAPAVADQRFLQAAMGVRVGAAVCQQPLVVCRVCVGQIEFAVECWNEGAVPACACGPASLQVMNHGLPVSPVRPPELGVVHAVPKRVEAVGQERVCQCVLNELDRVEHAPGWQAPGACQLNDVRVGHLRGIVVGRAVETNVQYAVRRGRPTWPGNVSFSRHELAPNSQRCSPGCETCQ